MSLYREMTGANWDPLYPESDQLFPTTPTARYRHRDEEDAIAAGRADQAAAVDPNRVGNSAWGSAMVRGVVDSGGIPDYRQIIAATTAIAGTADPVKIAMVDQLDSLRNL